MIKIKIKLIYLTQGKWIGIVWEPYHTVVALAHSSADWATTFYCPQRHD